MAQTTRTFRIFVSSTFSDLKEERNALQKHVFPRLRDLCTQHGCRFQAIDLRWGVREEAGLDQQTMKICLDEVNRSQRASPRPNFIVLLGDRYGWRPLPAEIPADEYRRIEQRVTDEGDKELLTTWYRRDDNATPPVYCLLPRKQHDRFANFAVWESEVERPLRRALLQATQANLSGDERQKYEASATEQEIDAGALKVPDAKEHVFCFLRKITNLPEDQSALDFVDLDERGSLNSEARVKLLSLKSRLVGGLPGNTHHYEARWLGEGISTDHIGSLPENLEECLGLLENESVSTGLCFDVWRRLARVILDEIGRLEKIEPLEKEISDHEAFGEDRARSFIGRASILERIDNYVRGTDRHPLAMFGESGSGKSAVMAKAIADCGSRNAAGVIVSRFIGATPASSDGRSLLESLCRQLTRIYGGDEAAVPTDYKELVKELSQRLGLATANKPLVLFLDAVDQLSDADHARNLIWLPSELPEHVRLIVSTLPGKCKSALERKLPATSLVELKAMPRPEGTRLLEAWLTDAGRTLQSAQLEEVLGKFDVSARTTDEGSGNEEQGGMPLYLKLAFEEARRWKSYSPAVDLDGNIPGIIRQLFDRLSLDLNHGKVIVERGLGYLAGAKNGLTEDELLDVLARDVDVYANFLKLARHIPSDLQPQLNAYLREIGETGDPLRWLTSLSKDEVRFKEFVKQMLEQAPELKLPIVLWSRLYFDLEPYLTERSADGASLMSFYHRQLGNVVKEDFLAGDDARTRHASLADYFASQELFEKEKKTPNIRKLSELPYQQTYGEQWDDLHSTLTDFDFLEAKCTHVAVITSGKGDDAKTIYGGVYELQEDYRRALEKFPA